MSFYPYIISPVIDVGAARFIIDGQVKVKHGCEIAAFKPRKVVFTDGTEIEADAVIFACVDFYFVETATDLRELWVTIVQVLKEFVMTLRRSLERT